MATTFSNVVSAKTLNRDGYGDGDGDGANHQAGPITFHLVPLKGGFCARLSAAGKNWRQAYNAKFIRLSFFEDALDGEAQNIEIYEVEPSDNITLQKTVLDLSANQFFNARFVLLNAQGNPAFVSSLRRVKTLASNAPVRPVA
jgi:uncharacterized protein YcsI (UPF0317 family)